MLDTANMAIFHKGMFGEMLEMDQMILMKLQCMSIGKSVCSIFVGD